MAWMYSMTSWPDPKHGRPHEYLVHYGCQVIYPEAKKWMRLPGRLVHQYYTDWRDASGPVHQDVHMTDQPNPLYTVVGGKQVEVEEPSLVDAFKAKYTHAGVVFMPPGQDPEKYPNRAKELEQQAAENFQFFIKECVENYKAQREVARTNGGVRMPTIWERHCFKLLGIDEAIFSTADEMIRQRQPQMQPQVTIQLTPEMVQTALEKATAPEVQKEAPNA